MTNHVGVSHLATPAHGESAAGRPRCAFGHRNLIAKQVGQVAGSGCVRAKLLSDDQRFGRIDTGVGVTGLAPDRESAFENELWFGCEPFRLPQHDISDVALR